MSKYSNDRRAFIKGMAATPLLASLAEGFFPESAAAAATHARCYCGRGYPRGLRPHRCTHHHQWTRHVYLPQRLRRAACGPRGHARRLLQLRQPV